MKEMGRREFVRTMATGGAVLGLGGIVSHRPQKALAAGRYDIGQCKSVRIKCISELGWYDSKRLLSQILGSPEKIKTSQWTIPWDPKNAGGSCSLIDIESLDGRHHKMLLDAGWSHPYMERCLKREGVDRMLKSGEIESLFISHEHLDHFWGLETILKYNPKITIFIPSTFYSEGMHFLRGATFMVPGAKNGTPHQGKLVQFKPGHINRLYDGCAGVLFDLPIVVRVRGEQSLYFNVKDKGIVCVSGCCHQKIQATADFAMNKILGGDKLYGVYGGLHIAPFGPMKPKQEAMVKGMGKYNFKKIACNHCTGEAAVKKMIELGYPVVKGTARYGSISDLYVGNGDEVFFG